MGALLVVGAGRLGTAVAARRRAAGERVLALRRTPGAMPEGVVPIHADVTRRDAFDSITESVSRVVYCVGPDSRTPEDYERSYVLGLSHLLTWLHATRQSPRLLFVSSTAVYAQVDGEWVSEESETAPTAPGPLVLLEAERMVRAYGRAGIVLRLAGLYGPDSPSLLERARQGLVPQRSSDRYVNRIHLTDAAAAVEHLLQLESPENLYLGVDDAPASQRTLYLWLSERFDLPRPAFGDPPEQSGEANKRCSNERLKRSGFSFQYPTFRDGYAELARAAGFVQRGDSDALGAPRRG